MNTTDAALSNQEIEVLCDQLERGRPGAPGDAIVMLRKQAAQIATLNAEKIETAKEYIEDLSTARAQIAELLAKN